MYRFCDEGKRRYDIKLRKAFRLLCLQVVSIMGVGHQIFTLWSRFVHYMTNWDTRSRSLGWSDDRALGWGGNNRGVSVTVVAEFPRQRDLGLTCHAHQVAENGSEYFAKRQSVTMFSAPNCCGEFDLADAMMRVDKTQMCSSQI